MLGRNYIHPTAKIAAGFKMGVENTICAGVTIEGFCGSPCDIEIGDCNIINENVRIIVGPGKFRLGDWGKIHQDTALLGPGNLTIGHNVWIGQSSWLDCRGGLTLGNGVRLGTHTNIWTHMAACELIEGALLFGEKPTVIEDEVWLAGNNVTVNPGLTLHRRSIALAHSLISHDMEANVVYAGSPARFTTLTGYKSVTIDQKYEMMLKWAVEFAENNSNVHVKDTGSFIRIAGWGDELLICRHMPEFPFDNVTYFDLSTKTYTKLLTDLEMAFYKSIYSYKARFIPCTKEA